MNNFNGMLKNNKASNISDEELMLALQKGRDNALDELMHRYKQSLFYFITRYTRNEDTSYDIVQETFFRVYNKAETFNSNYKFKTWLYQIALNLCRDYARKKKLQSLVSLDSWKKNDIEGSLYDILASDENIESLTEHRQTLKLLEDLIDKLPHKLKIALILFVIEDRSQEECAKILGITPKTIEMRVYRARKILLQNLSKKL